jgi:predicted metal-binding transcription factor (methanogenesis marker protein 9)
MWSVRFLQAMLFALTVGAMTAGLVIAIDNGNAWIKWAYIAATAVATVSALFSFCHMHMAEGVADEQLKREGLTDDRLLWVSRQLHEEVLARGRSSEVPRETTERLLRKALATKD